MKDFDDAYQSILSGDSTLPEGYVARIFHLPPDARITRIETSADTSFTARNLRASIYIMTDGIESVRKLFIKTAKPDKDGNSYHRMAMREGGFYKLACDQGKRQIPVPHCYDVYVSEEKSEFVIVLDDLSDYYQSPSQIDLLSEQTWLSCAECLARFHAASWNDWEAAASEMPLTDEAEIEKDANSGRESMARFLRKYDGELDAATKETFARAMEINLSILREMARRAVKNDHMTIAHGDSHIHNFLLPLVQTEKPVLIDFQFWGVGYGVGDLAHLTRVGYPDEMKRTSQIALVRRYHEALEEHGVAGYSWERCFDDYRRKVAAMVLIPFWQAIGFGVSFDQWIGSVKGLVENYRLLNCGELI